MPAKFVDKLAKMRTISLGRTISVTSSVAETRIGFIDTVVVDGIFEVHLGEGKCKQTNLCLPQPRIIQQSFNELLNVSLGCERHFNDYL